MVKFFGRGFWLAIMLLGLSNCTMVTANSVAVSEMPNPPSASATISVYPLDKNKANTVNYGAIARGFESDLTGQGFAVSTPFSTRTKYVVLIDYAIEMGVDQPWDRYITEIVYDTTDNKRVFQDDIESDGPSSDIVRVAALLFYQGAKDFKRGTVGENKVSISE
jgi:hypothetical protein